MIIPTFSKLLFLVSNNGVMERHKLISLCCRSVLYGLDEADRAISNLRTKQQEKIKLTG